MRTPSAGRPAALRGRPRLGPSDLAGRVAGWADAVGVRGRPAVIAVDGPSGAGKTSLALALADELGRAVPGAVMVHAVVVHLDDLYPGWDGLEAAVPILVDHVLRPLATDEPVTTPTWDWAHDRPGPSRRLPELGPPRPPVVIVEGAGAGARACAPHLAGLIFVEAPERVRRARALARDAKAYAPHWSRWAGQERDHFRREGTRRRADLLLDTRDDDEYPVVVRDGHR